MQGEQCACIETIKCMFYQPVLEARWFKPGIRYSQINWSSFSSVVSEFDGRIREWYLNPAKCLQCNSGHYAFSVMALACLLTDTLSQFHSGRLESSKTTFVAFVRQQFPEFSQTLMNPIQRPPGSRPPPQITDYAEALYHGFRCGILHEAHIDVYGAIAGQDTVVKCQADGITRYHGGGDCPTVIIDPKRFLELLDGFLVTYVSQLLDSNAAYDSLRSAFKIKFNSSFGIDITNSAL